MSAVARQGDPASAAPAATIEAGNAQQSVSGPCAIISAPDTSSPPTRCGCRDQEVEAAVADAVLLAQVTGDIFAPAVEAQRRRGRRPADARPP